MLTEQGKQMKNIIYSVLIAIFLLLLGCNNNKNVRQEFYPSFRICNAEV